MGHWYYESLNGRVVDESLVHGGGCGDGGSDSDVLNDLL